MGDRNPSARLGRPATLHELTRKFGGPYENRTRLSSVTGWHTNRYTNGP
jgi:hypothetical protein